MNRRYLRQESGIDDTEPDEQQVSQMLRREEIFLSMPYNYFGNSLLPAVSGKPFASPLKRVFVILLNSYHPLYLWFLKQSSVFCISSDMQFYFLIFYLSYYSHKDDRRLW